MEWIRHCEFLDNDEYDFALSIKVQVPVAIPG
jgi:hypothetical protein